jgi:hypothetical protein
MKVKSQNFLLLPCNLVNGTTGEGFSLTLEEREKIVEKWIEVGKKRYAIDHLDLWKRMANGVKVFNQF